MAEREALCTITATDAASGALDRLRAAHGEIILHITSGAEDAGTPMCLPAGELRLGVLDLFLGTVHGVDVFEMRRQPEGHFRQGSFVLDLRRGMPAGFSLSPDDGMLFVIRDSEPGVAIEGR